MLVAGMNICLVLIIPSSNQPHKYRQGTIIIIWLGPSRTPVTKVSISSLMITGSNTPDHLLHCCSISRLYPLSVPRAFRNQCKKRSPWIVIHFSLHSSWVQMSIVLTSQIKIFDWKIFVNTGTSLAETEIAIFNCQSVEHEYSTPDQSSHCLLITDGGKEASRPNWD